MIKTARSAAAHNVVIIVVIVIVIVIIVIIVIAVSLRLRLRCINEHHFTRLTPAVMTSPTHQQQLLLLQYTRLST